jgi:hypothetical protein
MKTPRHRPRAKIDGDLPGPIRVTIDGQLTASVTRAGNTIQIRSEPGWRLTEARITIAMEREEPPCNSEQPHQPE